MARLIFIITIIVSAFFLFLVQPFVGKLILPKLGGTPQVWNTCMLFFQCVLLLGYAYSHTISTRFSLRQQLAIHSAVLVIPIIIMVAFPIYAEVQGWVPPSGSNPIFDTLKLLAIVIGLPFLVVSTSAPLLQKWFGFSGDPSARDPYFLYSASNLGSLLSLLIYPLAVEPYLLLDDQAWLWFGGYVVLAGMIVFCAFTIFKSAPSDEQIAAEAARAEAEEEAKQREAVATPEPAPTPAPAPAPSTAVKSGPAPGAGAIQRKKGAKLPGAAPTPAAAPTPETPAPIVTSGVDAEMTMWRRIRWVLLAAVPSSLMLGVTSYVSTDLSPFPLLWVVPLALYLLSFIIVYLKGWTGRPIAGYTMHQVMLYVGQPIGLIILCYITLARGFDPVLGTFATMLGFFFNALACHGELAADRPSTKHLTEYFLLMSVGGAIGGTLNGLLAPILFQKGVLEFYIAVVVACVVRPQYVVAGWFEQLIMSAFPSMKDWLENQGDEIAKSMGRPAPRSTYLFSIFVDIIFGLFVLSISYWLKMNVTTQVAFKIVNFLSLPEVPLEFMYRVLVFGLPLVFMFFFAGRPLRFALATLGLFVGSIYMTGGSDERTAEARRTYFGVLRVMKEEDVMRPVRNRRNKVSEPDLEERQTFTLKRMINKGGDEIPPHWEFTYLMHGTTYHGRNYTYDPEKSVFFKDISRLATTYYHRYGPVGVVMEQDNWFKGPQGTFDSDVRVPAALWGQAISSVGMGAVMGTVPMPMIVEPWSEPPFATIGLGTGTMVSYARPFQHMTYYEIDDVIRNFSMPEDGSDAHFTFLQQAVRRGVNLEVVMGDARQSLQLAREKDNNQHTYTYVGDFSKFDDKAKDRFYAKAPYHNINAEEGLKGESDRAKKYPAIREKYYKVINVDAFSSDAIPVHLVTKQAIQLYLDKLRDDGVLCVHTSNRHLDLVKPVARIVMKLSEESVAAAKEKAKNMTFKDEKAHADFIKSHEINCIVGKDGGDDSKQFMGHFSSEYVMVYKGDHFSKYIKSLQDEKEKLGEGRPSNGRQILNSPVEWYNPYKDQFLTLRDGRKILLHRAVTPDDPLWTDDFSNIVSVVRWPDSIQWYVWGLGFLIAVMTAFLAWINRESDVMALTYRFPEGIAVGWIPVLWIVAELALFIWLGMNIKPGH